MRKLWLTRSPLNIALAAAIATTSAALIAATSSVTAVSYAIEYRSLRYAEQTTFVSSLIRVMRHIARLSDAGVIDLQALPAPKRNAN
jgi:hypothetical protein